MMDKVEAARYSTVETLHDGRDIEIRALRPDDRSALLAAVARTGPESTFRRFFAARRGFSEKEIEFFLSVDFVNHVALVAWVTEEGQPTIVGGGRYVVIEPGKAEVAFAVIDQYQNKGIGTTLMKHISTIAARSGITEFVAEVLPDNTAMLKVFAKSGFGLTTKGSPGVVHVALRLI
jgi:RimJ/RimL family protein N-acetyltransferase